MRLIAPPPRPVRNVGDGRPCPPPPRWPTGTDDDRVQAVAVLDRWRGLENAGNPAVRGWNDAEGARTRAYLDALPGHAAIVARLAALSGGGSPALDKLQSAGPHLSALYSDPAHQQPALVKLASKHWRSGLGLHIK